MYRYKVTDGYFETIVRADDARSAIDWAYAWDLSGLEYSSLRAERI